ncbi:MAG: glycosyltransferase [Coriobacteriales bacterium]|nr:glycosyltransferase [Coriobacteriales bacterium]
MTDFRFANVVYEKSQLCPDSNSIYLKTINNFEYSKKTHVFKLYGKGVFDFTTFFNALSILKLKKYTNAKTFYLNFSAKGSAFQVYQTIADNMSTNSQIIERPKLNIEKSAKYKSYRVKLDTNVPNLVFAAFLLKTKGNVNLKDVFYSLDIEKTQIKNVNLMLSTTTFKKEEYITKNISKVKREILDSNLDIAKHFYLCVVDNAKTLNVKRLEAKNIKILPNKNTGGSGGFARGMIHALENKFGATHILLMDDDVIICTESIIRTYNLLKILKSELNDAFISGAMLNQDYVYEFWEDAGTMDDQGLIDPVKPSVNVSKLQDCVLLETSDIDKLPGKKYSAWWYCCIPMKTVKKYGLPLPLFIRFDDVEYGIRCKPSTIITMTGICVWHSDFKTRFIATVERYQNVRNTYIMLACNGLLATSKRLPTDCINGNVHTELMKFNYTSARLALEGFEDFLAGPRLFSQKGYSTNTYLEKIKSEEKLKPISEIEKELGHSLPPLQDIKNKQKLRAHKKVLDLVTYNWQLLPLIDYKKNTAYVLSAGWYYQQANLHKAGKVVAVDIDNKLAIIRNKDKAQFREIVKRLAKDLKYFQQNKKQLQQDYMNAQKELTSVKFWKDYLGIK